MGEQLGELLRTWRQQRRLSLSALASRAGIAPRTVSGWELGERQPRITELNALLATLDIPLRKRHEALALIDAPRARRTLAIAPSSVSVNLDAGAQPVPGHLLQ